ncbi:hypothetical protein KEJ18_04135 [Candidatus Bathyarchaeota archaeon]|nr:hypothetical protein [Candidatus Bathyarchaeota archaeon]
MNSDAVKSGITLFIVGLIVGGFGWADIEYYLTELPYEVDEALYYLGGILAFIGFIYFIYRLVAKSPKPPETVYVPVPTPTPSPPPAPVAPPAPSQPPQQPQIKEKEVIIREVVKVKCRYCGMLVDSTLSRCPNCGSPMS